MIIKTGILGYGLSGSTFHGPFLKENPKYKVTKILSSRENDIKKDFPNVGVVSSVESVFQDPEIDLVVITTPNTTHFPYAKAALIAGKNVIVEKPFTPTLKEADELVALSKKKNLTLSVYQNRRWDGDYLTIKKILEEGLLGDIYQFESHMDRFRPTARDRWREKALPGSGILYDLGSHLLDQAFNLFGDPQWIWGDVINQKPDALTDDYFHIIMSYGDMRVLLHSSTFVKGKTIRYALHGTKGSFVKYGVDPQEERLREGQEPSEKLGKDEEEAYGILSMEDSIQRIPTIPGDYRIYFDSLADSIINKTKNPVSAESGAKVIKGLELIKTKPLQRHNW
ncbi:oxidoreductase [Spirochaeta cellobiosiphila]|uniref:oxidoreductase n=1 Tax=Spirochaeta cellobiosiphila TaxID=504483 RepID=UPI00040BA89D|nr:oxidoreductase [Spirochaeta cellobiosiphila]